MEDLSIINMIKQHQIELEQVEERTFDIGFLKPNFRQALSPMFIPPYGQSAYQLKDKIFNILTGTEIQILCSTSYTSPKAQIIKYVEIIMKLLDQGVFDSQVPPIAPWQSAPFPYFDQPTYYGTINTCNNTADKPEDNTDVKNDEAPVEFTKFGKVPEV
mgnify:CR=1 FL=1